MTTSDAESIQEQIAILRAILSTAVDAIITIDSQGRIRHANDAVCRMFQYSREELIGNNVSMLMYSPEREQHDRYLATYLETGEAHIIGSGRELIARRRDGTQINVDLAVSEVRVGNERLFTGILRDMTSRKQAEEMAQRERVFADSLFDTANAAVVVLDVDGRIARINPFLEELSGYSSQEIRQQDWFATFLPEDERAVQRAVFQQVRGGQSIEGNIHSIQTQSGSLRTLTWSACQLHHADDVQEGVLAIGSDITELKRAQSKLIERERLAAIGQMVTGLAHESRNALQRARAALDVLELDAEDVPRRLILQTQQALGELQRLYDEVRGYAAPIRLELRTHDLVTICRQTWEHLCVEHAPLQLQLQLENRLQQPTLRCDASRISQVLRNIYENAIAVSSFSGSVHVELSERLRDGVRWIDIRVQDEGPGLTQEQQKNIFTPFYTTKTRGTGLGMPISKRIVVAHEGSLVAMNAPSGGALVTVSIPDLVHSIEHECG